MLFSLHVGMALTYAAIYLNYFTITTRLGLERGEKHDVSGVSPLFLNH